MKSPAPKHLSAEAASWWDRIIDEYGIADEAGLLLLATALEAFDRLRGCQEIISREGATVLDRFEQTKAHPMLAAERDARSQLMQGLKALNLDLEPLRDGPGRPSGGY